VIDKENPSIEGFLILDIHFYVNEARKLVEMVRSAPAMGGFT